MSRPAPTRRKKTILFTGFGVFLLFVLAFSIFFYFNFTTVEVQGPSMEPTFKSGAKVLVTKAYWLVGPIEKNDIIVLRSPKGGERVIKRVYALEGQKVNLLNVPEAWAQETWPLFEAEYVVPAGHVYVLGDNKPASEDSREYGPVPFDRIIGKVIVAPTS